MARSLAGRATVPTELPEPYRILPVIVDFDLPGFSHGYEGGKSLALSASNCDEWFAAFVERVTHALEHRQFLPICRMSDGEFKFALGEQPESIRRPRAERLWRRLYGRLRQGPRGGAFGARTRRGVSSGAYSRAEWESARARYPRLIHALSTKGILALHLSFGRVPFQEHYFPALRRWLNEHGIVLTECNYFPFYFVYAMLAGPERRRILNGRRVLLVNAAEGAKRERIMTSIREIGAREVHWYAISASRSLYDEIDVSRFAGAVDLALVGAGVGKPNILLQLEPLGVPCVDAGYMFEVWSDPSAGYERAYCAYVADPGAKVTP